MVMEDEKIKRKNKKLFFLGGGERPLLDSHSYCSVSLWLGILIWLYSYLSTDLIALEYRVSSSILKNICIMSI